MTLTDLIIKLSQQAAPHMIKQVQIITTNREGQTVFLDIEDVVKSLELSDKVFIKAVVVAV